MYLIRRTKCDVVCRLICRCLQITTRCTLHVVLSEMWHSSLLHRSISIIERARRVQLSVTGCKVREYTELDSIYRLNCVYQHARFRACSSTLNVKSTFQKNKLHSRSSHIQPLPLIEASTFGGDHPLQEPELEGSASNILPAQPQAARE